MKLLSRELNQTQYKSATKTLESLAASLGKIVGQFKKVTVLGGIEKTLKAMKEVIWNAIDTFRKYTH